MDLINRDESILAFNARVLDMALRDDVPLLERLRFLCIVSSNLDEFFEVRMEPHVVAWREGSQAVGSNGSTSADASGPRGSLQRLGDLARNLVQQQYHAFNEAVMPKLAKQNIVLLSHGERTPAQRRWVRNHFMHAVRPLLVPIALDPAHPFPQVANKSLNFIVQLGGKDAFGRANSIAIVRVPRVLPRVIRLGSRSRGEELAFVSLSSVIRAHLDMLFPHREVLKFSQFRVTRHSDLAVDEDDVTSLRTALEMGLHQRNFGLATRVEVSSGCATELSDLLLKQFDLPPEALYKVGGPVNLVRFLQLVDMVDRPELKYAALTPKWPVSLPATGSLFDALKAGDALVHQPFESFDGVLALLRQAVDDPKVVAIKQTIYRTGSDRQMLDLLCEAVRRGKEVLAVVELRARFDEEANINWANDLERVGAQVVYGVVGLKTHAKMVLITRREGRRFTLYGHLATGNYNPKTARLYTDVGHFTADPVLTADMEQVFFHLASQSLQPKLKAMLLAPFDAQPQLVQRILATRDAALAGEPSRVVAKMNALTDEGLISALLEASQAGVQIDLVVRGACMLRPGVAGVSDNIRVRSVVGRFLEHSRMFYFVHGDVEQLYLSSADWMSRNMFRRIELVWPVDDAAMRERIVRECLAPYLHDTSDAWCLGVDGQYLRVQPKKRSKPMSVHAVLVAQFGGNAKSPQAISETPATPAKPRRTRASRTT